MLEDSSYSEFLSDRKQRVRLYGEVSASVDVVSGIPQVMVLRSSLFILYTFKHIHIVGNHIMNYADDTTICTVIPRPHSRPQVMESLNQDLAAIDSWC